VPRRSTEHHRIELGSGIAVTLVPIADTGRSADCSKEQNRMGSFVLETPAGKIYIV